MVSTVSIAAAIPSIATFAFLSLFAAALCVVPKQKPFEKYRPEAYKPKDGLASLSLKYSASRFPYNQALFGASGEPATNPLSNTELSFRMLQKQLKQGGAQAGNILISPITLARSLRSLGGAQAFSDLNLSAEAAKVAQATDYEAVIKALGKTGDVTLAVNASDDASAATAAFTQALAAQAEQKLGLLENTMSHMVKLPFPVQQAGAPQPPTTSFTSNAPSSSSSSATSTPASAPLTHSLNFTGYLAPKFTQPDSQFPNYFYNFLGEKTITHMMVKSSKMWYVEHEQFQMIDLPYLNPNFVATFILPRSSSDRTILDHPEEDAYDRKKRTPSTVHQVLDLLASPTKSGTNVFQHYAKYMNQMSGLVGLPGFEADCSVKESSVSASASASKASHRSVLSISPHGLDVGARLARKRPHQTEANFLALFDHPFIVMVRSTDPKNPQILFAGVINQVFQRTDWSSKYPMPEEWRNYKEEVGQNIQQLYKKVL